MQYRTDAYPIPKDRRHPRPKLVKSNLLLATLDLAHGHWQVPVADEDRHKTMSTNPLVYTNSV